MDSGPGSCIPLPVMGSDALSGEHPTAHTSTGEWQSFESRMRRRRIERLLARARVAHEEGHEDEARAALDEIEELNGGPIALSPGQQSPEIVFCQVADHDLTVFDTEVAVEFDPVVPLFVPVENDFEDLPLYPHLSSPSETLRSQWGPRAAAFLAACAVLFWLAGPRESQAPAAADVEAQSPSLAPSTQSVIAASRQPAAQPIADSGTAELAPVRLDVSDVSVDAARVDAPAGGAGPPVSLAGLAFAAPRATSPEPAVPDAVMPPAVTPLEQPTPPLLAAGVPTSSASTLEAVAPPAAALTPPPAPPPVESEPATPPPTASPAPDPAREADAPAPAAVAAAGVRATLLRYESAYSRLDVNAAGAVWPALDRKALARAFDGLASQAVSLGSCEVRIVGESAIADCAGSATWTPKVGGRSHRQARQWQFQLRNADTGWQIVTATVR